MLPMHYLAQWGPDGKQGQMNMGVLDMVLVSTGDKAANCDHDGNTAERLAMNAEYDGHLDVAKHIAGFLHRKGLGNGADPASGGGSSICSTVEVIRSPKFKNNKPVLRINVTSPENSQFNSHAHFNDDGNMEDEETVIEHIPDGNIEASLSMSARENMNHNHTPRSFSGVQKQPQPSPISTPKSGRNRRSFSWDDQGHNNDSDNTRDNVSISGSTWTTHLTNPPMSAPNANRQRQQQAGFPPMSPRQQAGLRLPPMSPVRVSIPKTRVRPQQTTEQSETRQDEESRRGNKSIQSGSTNSTNTNYSSQLTQQLVEIAEVERREGLESPRGNRAFVPKPKDEKTASEALLLEEIERLKAEKERDEESRRGNKSIQSGSTNSTNTNYSSQLTQQLVEIAEVERREGLESPRGNRAFVPKPKDEKTASEALLLEEIERLKAEKERAEADLVQARGAHLGGMVGSFMGLSQLSPIGEDEMSRLTTDEHEMEAQKQPTVNPSEEIGIKRMEPPVVSEIERLEKERQKIEMQLAKAKAEGPIDPEEESFQEEVKEDYMGLLEKEQNEHISTKNMLQEERKKHGDAIHSHLQEVKSLRESLVKATDEIAKYQLHDESAKNQSLQSEMKEFKKKELEWNAAREKLEAEIKQLKESSSAAHNHHADSDNSVLSTLTNNSGLDSSMLRMQWENSAKEANDLRKFSAAIRKEHNETVSELEDELERERTEKIKSMSNVVSLEYRISTLEEDLEASRADKSNNRSKFNSERIAELEENLERETSRKFALKQRVSTLEKDLEDALSRKQGGGGDLDRMAFELHQLKRKLGDKLEEVERSNELLDNAKREFERKEKNLRDQLHDAQEQMDMTMKQHQDTGDTENSYLEKISILKMRIQDLEEDDGSKSVKVRDAEKAKERAIQEKEHDCLEKIRQLKKEYEVKLQDKEDAYLQDIRDLKIKQENDFREKEGSYLRDLRDAKKRENDLQDNEATLTKMMKDGKMKDSYFELDVSKMIEEKENAFKEEVAKLTAEIEALRQESANDATCDELEARLLECKSDLKSQCRKQRSQISKLKNTLQMQKSKEARLEGHIKTMEKQIMDMTSEYEERIQEYLYGNMDTE